MKTGAGAAICLVSLLFASVDRGDVQRDQKGVEYGRPNGHPLLLDLHVPDGPGPFPAAILVHGGGFDGGSRATNMSPTFQPLADAGFAWFSVDYRMAPDFRFAEAKADIDAAITWLKANAKTYKVDPARIVLAGESAGGFLVNYAGTHETPATRVAAVVDIYGPADYEKIARQRQAYPNRFNMTSIEGHMKNGGSIAFFGATGYDEPSFAKLKAVSPIYAVHKDMAPFLAIHGTRDDQVPYEQSPMLCDAMHKVGARCEIITVEAGGHGMGSWKDADQQHYKAEMIAWLKDVLGQDTPLPAFGAYHVDGTFTGKPAAVVTAGSKLAQTYRTKLREGASAGPNFAGDFTLVSWGCGAGCQDWAVVDARTGKVFESMLRTSVGAEFRRDSRLVLVDTPKLAADAYGGKAPADCADCGTPGAYEWRDGGWRAVAGFGSSHVHRFE